MHSAASCTRPCGEAGRALGRHSIALHLRPLFSASPPPLRVNWSSGQLGGCCWSRDLAVQVSSPEGLTASKRTMYGRQVAQCVVNGLESSRGAVSPDPSDAVIDQPHGRPIAICSMKLPSPAWAPRFSYSRDQGHNTTSTVTRSGSCSIGPSQPALVHAGNQASSGG